MLTGLALIVLPYVIDQTLWLYVAGAALCGSLYWFRS